jgi:hypothetical protein
MIKTLPVDATAEDVVEAVATEVTHRLDGEMNADSPLIQAYAIEMVELFRLIAPKLLGELARTNPTLVLTLCEQWATSAREHLADHEPQAALSWEQQFERALQAVYAPADVAVLLKAEGIDALSTNLRKRVEETGENPGDVLKRISRADRVFALAETDAPGAFLANRVRGLGR